MRIFVNPLGAGFDAASKDWLLTGPELLITTALSDALSGRVWGRNVQPGHGESTVVATRYLASKRWKDRKYLSAKISIIA